MSDEMKGKAYTLPMHPEMGTLEVYKYPDRKSFALCMTKGSYSTVLAYFRSEERAQEFMDWMNSIARK